MNKEQSTKTNTKPLLSKEEFIKKAKSSGAFNSGKWGKATVEALRKIKK